MYFHLQTRKASTKTNQLNINDYYKISKIDAHLHPGQIGRSLVGQCPLPVAVYLRYHHKRHSAERKNSPHMAHPTSLNYSVTELGDTPSGGSFTILIAEDHEIVRDGLQKLVVRVLGPTLSSLTILHAKSLLEARSIIEKKSASLDLILLDLELEDASAEDCIHCLMHEWDGLPIAVVSANENWELARALVNTGLLGFIPKSCSVEILTNAIRLIVAGGRYFPDEVLLAINNSNTMSGGVTPATMNIYAGISNLGLPRDILARLTPRQLTVLNLVIDGLANKEIAKRLSLSVGTTKNYVASIMRVLGVTGRVNVVRAVTELQNSVNKDKS
jgi:DNA-binding NarL/FixJ family response regulator